MAISQYGYQIFDLGIAPEGYKANSGTRKPFDIEGLALEFAKFEALYDTNRQVYEWLYHTGYGRKLWDELIRLTGSWKSASNAVTEAARTLK